MNVLFIDWTAYMAEVVDRCGELGYNRVLFYCKRINNQSDPKFLKYLKEFEYVVETNTTCADDLITAIKRLNILIHCIINFKDRSLLSTALACEALGLRFTHSSGIINAQNKLKTRLLLDLHKI